MDERRARHFLAKPLSDPDAEGEVNYEERIRRLELEARPLDPSAEERVLLRDKVVAYADAFLEGLAVGQPSLCQTARIPPYTTRRSQRGRLRTLTRPWTCWIVAYTGAG